MSLMDTLAKADPELKKHIDDELSRQRSKLELIASENIVSRAVMEAQGSVLTNKYAEGYPGKRYYGGCGRNSWPSTGRRPSSVRGTPTCSPILGRRRIWRCSSPSSRPAIR